MYPGVQDQAKWIAAGWGCRYVLLKDYVKSAKVGGFETWIISNSNGMPRALGGNQLIGINSWTFDSEFFISKP